MPAGNAKTGAQKWVIQLVKKSPAVVRVRSVGEKDIAEMWMKSRTWSRAMMMTIAPRRASTAWTRAEPEVSAIDEWKHCMPFPGGEKLSFEAAWFRTQAGASFSDFCKKTFFFPLCEADQGPISRGFMRGRPEGPFGGGPGRGPALCREAGE